MSPGGGQNHAQLRTTNLDDEYVRHKLEQGQRFWDRNKFSKLKEKEGQWSWQLLSE